MAQWIRSRTLRREVPGSNLLATAVVPLFKALYPHFLVPRKGLKVVGPLHSCLFISIACSLSGHVFFSLVFLRSSWTALFCYNYFTNILRKKKKNRG